MKRKQLAVLFIAICLCLTACLSACNVSYKVTFMVDGAQYAQLSVARGKTMTLPDAPSKQGHIFEGWFYGAGLETEFTGVNVRRSYTVYAKWTTYIQPFEYIVSFESNGGAPVEAATFLSGTTFVFPADPARDAYVFMGWFLDDGVFAEAFTVGFFDGISEAGAVTVYAKWEAVRYPVVYVLNGGANHAENPETYTVEDGFTLKDPSRTGYTFTGWTYEGQSTPVKPYVIAPGTTGDLTLTANWVENAPQAYALTVTAESGGTVNTSGGSYVAGAVISLVATPYAGYAFDGWFEGMEMLSDSSSYGYTMPARNAALTARFSEIETEFTPGLLFTPINGGLAYEVSVGTSTASGYTAIVIPAFYDGLPVTKIAANGFSDNSPANGYARTDKITSVSVPSGVTEFGNYAFANCASLTYLFIPENATLGTGVAYGCSSLEAIETSGSYPSANGFYIVNSLGANSKIGVAIMIKNGVNYTLNSVSAAVTEFVLPRYTSAIGAHAFHGCTRLEALTITSTVKSLGSYAFQGCTSLTSIVIPSTLTDGLAPLGTFLDCTALSSVSLPNGLTTIPNTAFKNCTALNQITIPSSVTTIGVQAFYRSGLKGINIPANVKSVGTEAFINCTSLTTLTIGSRVETIGSGAFSGCSLLTSLNIPSSVREIGEGAFSRCTGLTSLEMPDSVISVGKNAFSLCSLLTTVKLSKNLTEIPEGMFSSCFALKTITLHEGITSVGKNAFAYGQSLLSIMIPKGTLSIEEGAFEYSSIISVALPDTLVSIGAKAFNYTALSSITIPASVTTIGASAFTYPDYLTIYTPHATKPASWSSGWNSLNRTVFWGCVLASDTVDARGLTYVVSFTKSSATMTNVGATENVMPYRCGFSFMGWYASPSFTGTRYMGNDIKNAPDGVYYVKWEEYHG